MMFDKQWLLKRQQQDDRLIPYLLRERGIGPEEEASFLNPSCTDLEDPSNPVGMVEAVERILTAVDQGEQITVFGDYDADGITATSVLVHFLRYYLRAQVDYYIPDRFTEGYGMSIEAIERLKEQGTSLIITVDNGVSALLPAKRAGELGMDLIITDHHQCPEELPSCLALLDPHVPGSGFAFQDLAGVGVAYMLVRALGECIGLEEEIYTYLPIVALGTVGDCMNLVGQNRIIVRHGLMRVGEGAWLGLTALLQKSGLDNSNGGVLTATDLSFRIVPKLNAAGRLGNASRAVELLLSQDLEESLEAAEVLIRENKKRQETEAQIYEEAIRGGSLLSKNSDSCVIAYGKDWHHGVIGIVASRLTEQYGKPAIVFSSDGMDEEGFARMKGSARSVPGFHLYDALSRCSEFLEKFGGHEMAAGITIQEKAVPKLIEGLNRYGREVYEKKWVPPHVKADGILNAAQVTIPFIRELSKLEPFGEGNPKPVFIVTNLTLMKTVAIGNEGKHLRLTFRGEGVDGRPVYLDGISFGNGRLESTVKHFTCCAVLCTLEINTWNGMEKPSLHIIDLHDFHISLEKRAQCLYNNAYTTFESFTLSRNLLKAVYKAVVSFGAHWTFNDLIGARTALCRAGIPCSWYSLRSAISVFTEIGLIARESGTSFTLLKTEGKLVLSDSSLYRAIASAN